MKEKERSAVDAAIAATAELRALATELESVASPETVRALRDAADAAEREIVAAAVALSSRKAVPA